MNASVFIIAETQTLATAVQCYLEGVCKRPPDCIAWTYGRDGIPGDRYRAANLLILSLLGRDDLGYRAEGLGTAEKMAPTRRRVLLISGCAVADRLACPYYWDLASPDTLCVRVEKLLKASPPTASDYAGLKEHFRNYIRPAVDRHRMLRLQT